MKTSEKILYNTGGLGVAGSSPVCPKKKEVHHVPLFFLMANSGRETEGSCTFLGDSRNMTILDVPSCSFPNLKKEVFIISDSIRLPSDIFD